MKKGFFIGADRSVPIIFLGSFVLTIGLFALLGYILESFGLPMKYGEPTDTILLVIALAIAILFASFVSRWVWKKAKEENDMPLVETPVDKKRWADILTACALILSLILIAGSRKSGKFSIGVAGVVFFVFALSVIIKSYKGETTLGIFKRISRTFLFLILIIGITAIIIAAFVVLMSL